MKVNPQYLFTFPQRQHLSSTAVSSSLYDTTYGVTCYYITPSEFFGFPSLLLRRLKPLPYCGATSGTSKPLRRIKGLGASPTSTSEPCAPSLVRQSERDCWFDRTRTLIAVQLIAHLSLDAHCCLHYLVIGAGAHGWSAALPTDTNSAKAVVLSLEHKTWAESSAFSDYPSQFQTSTSTQSCASPRHRPLSRIDKIRLSSASL